MKWSRIDRSAALFSIVIVMLIAIAGCIEPIPTDPEPYCGDGLAGAGEQCDYGTVNTNEACTPGYGETCTYCTTSCTLETVEGGSCGDGVCQAEESCVDDCGLDFVVPTGSFLAEYYAGSNFDTRVTERIESSIEHDWGQNAPLEGMDADNFSVRWTGLPDFEAGDYVFTAAVDDGIRIYVDDELILESWQNQGSTTYTSDAITLSAGEHEVVVEYYESHSSASVQVSWSAADEVNTTPNPTGPEPYCGDGIVDNSEQCDEGSANSDSCTPGYGQTCSYCTTSCTLETVTGGSCGDGVCQNGESCSADCGSNVPSGSFLGEYYTGQFDTLVTSREDAAIDFDWGQGSPMNTVDADYFSVRWTGLFDFEAGDYVFTAAVDDGIRVYVDDVLVIESWQNQGSTTYTSDAITLSAGEHEIMVEYYEAYASASVSVSWTPADEVNTNPNPSDPSDSTYGARPVARSKTPSSSDTFVSTSGSGTSCTQPSPCSLSTGISRSGHIWLNPGTYTRSSQISLGSDRIVESIDPNDKAIIDFAGSDGRVTLRDNIELRNVIVRRSSRTAVVVWGNGNLIEGVTSEHNFGSGFQVWPDGYGYGDGSSSDLMNPPTGRENVFRDSIGRYNNDDCCAISCGATTCSDSDADGFSFSAGAYNVIDHSEAYGNTDDGFDIWRSYASTVRNSVAHSNGYDDGVVRGNGNGFKMGSSSGPNPNDHVVEYNWAYGNAAYSFVNNGGVGTQWGPLVCTESKTACDPTVW